MNAWIYMLHPPRDNFMATMTDDEKAAWGRHFQWLQELLAQGALVLAGASGGSTNTGIGIFEFPDEASARDTMAKDPAVLSGFAHGELRPFQLGISRETL